MSALVSIVVPVFNGMPHLANLAESILAQTHVNLDIVFVDGGSTDESAVYLATITDPRVRVLTMPPGTSAAQNWDAASEAAQGAFVKLICQDDLLRPDAIARQLSDLISNPNAVMAIAQRDVVDAKGDVLYPNRGCAGLKSGVTPGTEVLKTAYLQGTNIIGEPLTVLFTREAFMAALPWDDTDPFLLDLAFYSKVARSGDVVVRREAVGSFRVSTSSWSTRLIGEQVRQFERWQRAFEGSLATRPSAIERARAKFGLHTQALLRRAAYRWLRTKGSFHSSASLDSPA
jgi:hypothetical protein